MFCKFPAWLIAEYLRQINQELFNGAIKLHTVKVKQTLKEKHIFAYCLDKTIELNPKAIKTTDELFNTLAHELIHVYQFMLGLPTNHNGKFFKVFAKKACNLYGFPYNEFKGWG